MSNHLEDLCLYDPRNPLSMAHPDNYPTDDIPEPRQKSCSCENCFYGRDRLALRIEELEAENERLREERIAFATDAAELEAQLFDMKAERDAWKRGRIQRIEELEADRQLIQGYLTDWDNNEMDEIDCLCLICGIIDEKEKP